jgi:hypothetical protein
MSKMHVISPAPSASYRPGALQQIPWSEFARRATRTDAEGFPVEGFFGVSWAADIDLRTATEDEIKAAMLRRATAWGEQRMAATLHRDTQMLLQVYNTLKKGEIIAFKKGTTIIAFVELTSDYQFCPDERWGWHSWSYRLVRKATAADQPANRGALVKTFFPHFLTRPLL